jgi:hypothetical protein
VYRANPGGQVGVVDHRQGVLQQFDVRRPGCAAGGGDAAHDPFQGRLFLVHHHLGVAAQGDLHDGLGRDDVRSGTGVHRADR